MPTNPLAPNPTTDIDGPDVFPPIEPEPNEDLGTGVPVGEPEEDPEDEKTNHD